MNEKKTFHVNGYLGLVVLLGLLVGGGYLFYLGVETQTAWQMITAVILGVIALLFLSSLTIVSPNQSKAILFFGQYLGTIRSNGLFITTP